MRVDACTHGYMQPDDLRLYNAGRPSCEVSTVSSMLPCRELKGEVRSRKWS